MNLDGLILIDEMEWEDLRTNIFEQIICAKKQLQQEGFDKNIKVFINNEIENEFSLLIKNYFRFCYHNKVFQGTVISLSKTNKRSHVRGFACSFKNELLKIKIIYLTKLFTDLNIKKAEYELINIYNFPEKYRFQEYDYDCLNLINKLTGGIKK